MKIYIGADHKGFKLKDELKIWFIENKIDREDMGAFEYDPEDDYPIYAEKVAKRVAEDLGKNLDVRGIVLCGSGVGVDIVANKFKHIRSGLALNVKQVLEARKDDDINILAIPSDFVSEEKVKEIVKIFLKTPFSKEEKKIRRLKEIDEIEHGL
ncbi:MAG: hypothetical protein A3B44_03725 [Candidatus Levybacteria bacterium RIFCSPLOWO2_01_FULL_38_21]|nr:MAG: hypothetical protein A3B44_03725 [Candidatus Levybacteria bacterium RIFCSPLOWO2_01_FULL_38_21]